MANTKKAAAGKNQGNEKINARAISAAGKKPETSAGADGVTVDRRAAKDRRAPRDRRKKCEPVAVERRTTERRVKVNRRRQIDPTTCERDYSVPEIEFMNALEEYKRASGRMFPTCSEVLEVIRSLGYQRLPAQPNSDPPPSEPGDALPADQPQVSLPRHGQEPLAVDSLVS